MLFWALLKKSPKSLAFVRLSSDLDVGQSLEIPTQELTVTLVACVHLSSMSGGRISSFFGGPS